MFLSWPYCALRFEGILRWGCKTFHDNSRSDYSCLHDVASYIFQSFVVSWLHVGIMFIAHCCTRDMCSIDSRGVTSYEVLKQVACLSSGVCSLTDWHCERVFGLSCTMYSHHWKTICPGWKLCPFSYWSWGSHGFREFWCCGGCTAPIYTIMVAFQCFFIFLSVVAFQESVWSE